MSSYLYSKLIGCNVYGAIRVSSMALKIIDTPEFQRMRGIKQLGLCHHVYPAATHTRFEHSIGVYHLAGRMLEKIQQQYPNNEYYIPELGSDKIKLTYKVAECIKIAGLCHDIGHGPFGHMFDDIFLNNSKHPNSHHEIRSCLITELLCKRELHDELDDNHITFIKSIIDPQQHHCGALYQIVANHLNGIDVDKFDYLARDTKNLGLNNSFNANRLIDEFIIDHNGNIAYPKHCSSDIYDMFHSRYMMHKKVYSHKTVKLIELMMNDLFIKIDPIFNISKSIDDMEIFCKLTDNTIFYYTQSIIYPPNFLQINLDDKQYQMIKEANDIYQNIISRNLYQQVLEMPEDEKVESYMQGFFDYLLKNNPSFCPEDFQIIKIKIGFVSDNKQDPFDSIYFYDKKENDLTFTIKKNYFSGLMNNKIQEIRWYFICKKRSIYHIVINELKIYNKNWQNH